MNYRHAFHAGNFADVLKHAVLARVLDYMKRKPAPFRVVDTHAGCGGYDLGASEAERTGEWREGIGRLAGPDAEPLPEDIAVLLHPYLDVVRSFNAAGPLRLYPGSPVIALRLMRPDDRLVASELHPEDAARLREAIGQDARAKVMERDGWQTLKAVLPPKERRGLVLVDPPFEAAGELDRLARSLDDVRRRFATGTALLWFPIKDQPAHRRFVAGLDRLDARLLLVELSVGAAAGDTRLAATGLVILNPPYTLEADLALLLPFLAGRLARGAGKAGTVRRLGTASG